MQTRFYYVSRRHFLFFLIFAAILLSCSLWLVGEVLRDPRYGSFADRIPALILTGTFCLVFTTCVVALVRRLRSDEPTVTLDADGITLGRGVNGVEVVSWSQITGTRILDQSASVVGRVRHLVIEVKNADDLLNSVPNPLERAIARLNAGSFGSPIYIGAEMVSEPLANLQVEIENRIRERHRLTEGGYTATPSGVDDPEPLRIASR